MPARSIIPIERIEAKILLIRGQKVLIDADLAELYGVPTKVLVQAVKRNLERFPADFMFQLTDQEFGRCGHKLGPHRQAAAGAARHPTLSPSKA